MNALGIEFRVYYTQQLDEWNKILKIMSKLKKKKKYFANI